MWLRGLLDRVTSGDVATLGHMCMRAMGAASVAGDRRPGAACERARSLQACRPARLAGQQPQHEQVHDRHQRREDDASQPQLRAVRAGRRACGRR